jgi:NAD(P)-dependent dehydrogenase (short-subunit alcohol dehydrogenase family)
MVDIDSLLDRTIAPGYGKLGLTLRRRLRSWPDDPPRMDGQVVMVTGAASGIGLAAAQGFAALGATVLAVARDEQRARDAEQAVSGDVRGVACDVSSVAALRELAASVEQLDVLVNNAGVMPPERTESVDGVELTFATHVLGPFVLIQALAPVLEASAPARVINVVSGGMYTQALRPDDLMSERDEYDPKTVYARSKRAQVVLTEQLATRLAGTGVVVHAMHPGWADTAVIRHAMPVFRKVVSPILRDGAAGADTIVWLGGAAEPLQSTGKLWMDRRVRPTRYRFGADEDPVEAREALWALCSRLAGAVP